MKYLFWSAGIASALSLSLAAAQPAASITANTPKLEKFESWTKVCVLAAQDAPKSTKPRCHLEQSFASPRSESQQPIFIWRLSMNDKKEVFSYVMTPNNVLLAAGIEFNVSGEKPTIAPYFTCQAGFCESRLKLDSDIVKAMTSKATVQAKFKMTTNEEVAIAVPMNGLAKGLASL